MRRLPLALLLACGLSAAATLPPPPCHVCARAAEEITIDGRGEEQSWQQATPLSPLRDIEGAPVDAGTEIRLLWDDNYLYVLADMKEPHLWATLKERDSIIYHDPDFEVFIDPDGDGNNYIEIEVNALNTIWDLFLTAPYRSANHALHDWNIPGLKSAVYLRGSLNNATDTDEGWSVELAIPWCSITGHSNHPRCTTAPSAGTTLRMNFSRVNWQVQPDTTAPCGYVKRKNADGNPLPESNHVWAPTGIINIHYPEFWGYVKLSDKPSGSGYEGMIPPATDSAQRQLYSWYNEQLSLKAKQGSFSSTLQHQGVTPLYVSPTHFVARSIAPDGQLLTIDSSGQLLTTPPPCPRPPIYLWVQGGKHEGDSAWWQEHFARLADAGVHAVIIGGSPAQLRHLVPIARTRGLEVYAWLWCLNRPQDSTALQHPDWYAVNRLEKSCHRSENRPFVEYYQFLCPNNEKVLNHLLQKVDELAAIHGLSGIQLDYMRLPDVILPRGLWEKYGLTMDRELPEYDYCYCERCKAAFRQTQGRNIETEADNDAAWRDFRLSSVAKVANALCRRIRSHNLRAACAVFPTPQLAAQLVRQDWSRFELDLALPMTYTSFYNEDEDWPLNCTRKAGCQTQARLPLAPGLHLPDISPEQLAAELERLRQCSPCGIGLFCDDDLSPAHLDKLKQLTKSHH